MHRPQGQKIARLRHNGAGTSARERGAVLAIFAERGITTAAAAEHLRGTHCDRLGSRGEREGGDGDRGGRDVVRMDSQSMLQASEKTGERISGCRMGVVGMVNWLRVKAKWSRLARLGLDFDSGALR